ncbi:MAG TPA: serine/threonine-protein kinase [Lacipirellulaceae bacterium]|nr:serine/threonine-protein kinase [Lacipirellulaceae bacterium]
MIIDAEKAQSIFISAVENYAPDEWNKFLDDACREDVALRQRVELLLRAHQGEDSLLDRGDVDSSDVGTIAEQPGTVIGPYKLLQQIGEGGFGVVFLAEQERPVKRRVALKVIKPGMDTRQVIARFEAERQALALMDHPNIAKVHDAGATENGRPYFVMELVQGVSITEYCDQCNLTTRERLELFIIVCHAVQHAHQKGVIHRDIKPTNVLVAMQDDRLAPKIIDFGVAKAVGQRLTEHALTTAFAQMVGSPLYMSPEQAELSALGVDTRSDIYSLGVLLYELLTGATPFDKDRLHAASYDELRRIIREEEPPRPSTRISTLAADLATTVADRRRTDARHLRQQVRGELDWIVMKCLEKDRNRRYETPSSLARDVERYLHDEPVQACPPSAGYRLKKFVRRNKVAAAFVALLLAGVAGLGISNIAIKRERDAKTTALARAQTVSDLLQEMLGSADAARAKGVDYKVRELLDDFSAGLDSQPTVQPEVEADIRATIGRAYRSVQQPDQAQPHFEKAIELQRRIDGPQSEKLAAILVDYAWNLQDQKKYAEAETQIDEALMIYRKHGDTGAPLFHALEILQHVLINSGRDEDAERVTREALGVAGQSGQEFADQANLLHRYAGLKIRQGDFAKAEQISLDAVDLHRRLHGEYHPETAFGLKTLASALEPQQKLAEAEKAVRESLAIFRRQFPEDHPNVRGTFDQLRNIVETRGDKPALAALDKEKDEYAMRAGSPDYHIQLAEILTNQSRTAREPEDARLLSIAAAARTEEAHRHIRQAIEAYDRLAIDYPDDLDRRLEAIAGFIQVLKVCLAAPGFAGEVDELNHRLEAELPKLVAAFPDSNHCQLQTAYRYVDWASALYRYRTYRSVEEHAFRKEIEILEKIALSNPKQPSLWLFLADAYDHLGSQYWESARPQDAEAAFLRSKEIYDEHPAEIAAEKQQPYGIACHYVRLAYFLAHTHREVEAAECARKAADVAKRITDPVHLITVLWAMAPVQLRMGDHAGYRATCQALVEVPLDDVDDFTKMRQIFAWVHGPNALDDLSLPVKRAEELAAHNSIGRRDFILFDLGAAHYRNHQYERAVEQLEASIAAYPSDPEPGHDPISLQRLFLAMTKWQLGQQHQARQLLEKTLTDIDKDLQSTSLGWNQRAALEVLRREAKTLIEPKEANEAVQNKSPDNDRSSESVEQATEEGRENTNHR